MAAVLLACLVACLATKSLNKALSLQKALLILPFMAEPALSLNKAVLSLALLAEPGYSAFRWWRVREFKGQRWYQSLQGKWYTLMPEDEESLNKAVEDDWTIGAFIAGESACCAWEEEWETDEEAPYFNPDTGRWVRPHWGVEQNGWEQATPLQPVEPAQGNDPSGYDPSQGYFGGYGPAQGQASSSSSSWHPHKSLSKATIEIGNLGGGIGQLATEQKLSTSGSLTKAGKAGRAGLAGHSQQPPQSLGKAHGHSLLHQQSLGKARSRDETPLRPSRWDLKGREPQTRRAARRKLMREGQPVPEHLLPQVLDMKAIKKEMAYLVSLAREAAAAAAAAAEPEQGKGKGPGQGQKRPKSKEPGKGKEKGKSKAKSRERKPRSPSKPPPSKGTPAQVQKEQLGEKVPGEGKAASPGTPSSYSNTSETVSPQEVKDNPEPVQGLNAIPEPAEPEQGCEAKPEPEAQPQEPEQGCEAKEEPLLETQAQPQPVEAEQANPIEPEQGCADHDGGEEEEEEPVEEEQEEEREAEKKRKKQSKKVLEF